MGLGRLYDARSCPLPTRGAAACAHLQLVEHLRPARRSPPPSRGDHQPSPVPDGDRHPHPSCAANDDPRDELARQGRARRPGACGRRRLPAGPGQKCGAVDPPANMASDLVARLPGIPQRPPPPRPAPPRAKLMQPKREKSLTPKRHIGQLPFLGSMTTATQPKPNPLPAILVYGTPSGPALTQASWFRAEDKEAVKAAAEALKFSVIELQTDADRALAAGAHEGVLKGSGRMIVGSVSAEVYRRIEEHVRKGAGAPDPSKPDNAAAATTTKATLEQNTNIGAVSPNSP